jgi:beta-lactam-binding protein with PASTA domain
MNYEIIGNGDFVLKQTPEKGDTISNSLSKVILYTEEAEDFISVPALVGLEISEAVAKAVNSGLNIRLTGNKESGNVITQSLPVGAKVKRGSIIELEILICDFEG